MKIDVTCALVRDLLPLYADGVLSGESSNLVETHLPECPPCSEELERLRAPVPVKQKKTARQSLKTTRRKLIIGIGAALLAIAVLLMAGFVVLPDGHYYQPIDYSDGMFEPLFAFRAAADDSMGEGDFIKVQLARQPRFEYGGVGSIDVEDVVTIDGQRVGVAYVQYYMDPMKIALSESKAAKDGGRNPDILAYGCSYLKLLPMSEAEKAAFRAWETEATGSALAVGDEVNFANWARDIPITRLYYYNGPTKNLVNEALGWSQRNGVLAESVLIWEAGSE